MKFGIDFGTSYSSMSYLNSYGKVELIRDADGLEKIPSIVYWGKNEIKVGQAAADILQDAYMYSPEEQMDSLCRVVKSIKRNFYPDYTIALPDGKIITALDVVSEIFKYLKNNAEELCFHKKISSVTLTHPVSFSEVQKKMLVQCAKKAGFLHIDLLEEPIAAALGYVVSGTKIGDGILVYDLGGGTLDLAYMKFNERGEFHFPVAPIGDYHCGGDDLDHAIYEYAEKDIKNRFDLQLTEQDSYDLNFLWQCRKLKEKLSNSEKGKLLYFLREKNISYNLELSRIDFEKLIFDKIQNSINLTEKFIAQINNEGHKIDTILLIGGSSRVPLISAELAKVLPVPAVKTMLVDTAVAMGAATDTEQIFTVLRKERENREKEKLRLEEKAKREKEQKEKQKREFEQKKNFAGGLNFTITHEHDGICLPMIWCPPGSFLMGSRNDERGRKSDEFPHRVDIEQGFWISKYPVSQKVFDAFMNKNPSHFKWENADAPVEMVSWYNATAFCKKLNIKVQAFPSEMMDKYQVALPSEIEWEYACRANTQSSWNNNSFVSAGFGSGVDINLDKLGWYRHNSSKHTHTIGTKAENAWGIADMHGNVFEWCRDFYGNYPKGAVAGNYKQSAWKRFFLFGKRPVRGGAYKPYVRIRERLTRIIWLIAIIAFAVVFVREITLFSNSYYKNDHIVQRNLFSDVDLSRLSIANKLDDFYDSFVYDCFLQKAKWYSDCWYEDNGTVAQQERKKRYISEKFSYGGDRIFNFPIVFFSPIILLLLWVFTFVLKRLGFLSRYSIRKNGIYQCRSAAREKFYPWTKKSYIGFRIVLTANSAVSATKKQEVPQ